MAPSLSTASSSRYAIVIDAGSSGSRLQIYSWKDPEAERAQIIEDVKLRLAGGRFGGSSSRNKGKGKAKASEEEAEREVEKALSRLVKIGKGVEGDDWVKRTEPGISTITPSSVSAYLSPLLKHALESIPPSQHGNTPIYLLATAGMRLLPPGDRDNILAAACSTLRDHYPFRVEGSSSAGPCGESVRVISGEEEGMWGWVAVNYLMDGFGHAADAKHGKGRLASPESTLLPLPPLVEDSAGLTTSKSPTLVDPHQRLPTFGFLDMGGASTQLAFSPTPEELARSHFPAEELRSVTLRLLSGRAVEWPVFVASWLGFGTNKVRERYVELKVKEWQDEMDRQTRTPSVQDGSTSFGDDPSVPTSSPLAGIFQPIQDPCLPAGLSIPPSSPHHPTFVGTGSFSECLTSLVPLLETTAPCPVPAQHCLFAGLPTPHIDFTREDQRGFIGISEYWYTAQQVLGLGGVWDWGEWERGMEAFCQRDWRGIEDEVLQKGNWRGSAVELSRLEMQCFKGAWISNVLHEGIGIPRISDAGGNLTLTGGNLGETNDEAERRAREKGLLSSQSRSSNKPAHFQSLDSIGETAVSWTLGKMVIEASKAVKLHGHHDERLGIQDRWKHALLQGGGRLSGAMHLDDVQAKLEGYGIPALWTYWFLGVAMLGVLLTLFRRRLRRGATPSSKRRKPSDVGMDWVKGDESLSTSLLRGRPIAGGRLKIWMYRLSSTVNRLLSPRSRNPHALPQRRPSMRHQQSAPAGLSMGDLRRTDNAFLGTPSQPPSPPALGPNGSHFFIPGYAASPPAVGRRSMADRADGAGTLSHSPSSTSMRGHTLSHKSSTTSLNRSKPRQFSSNLSHESSTLNMSSGGWNDPPYAAFQHHTDSEDDAMRTNSSSILIPHASDGAVLSRNSSRVSLSDLSNGPRPIPRVSTPVTAIDPGGYS